MKALLKPIFKGTVIFLVLIVAQDYYLEFIPRRHQGFVIEQVALLNELRLPNSVVQNIEAKVNATQMALRKNEELAQAEADAQKKIADAIGKAESLIIVARAEAEANRVRQASLTRNLLMQQWIEKWNGTQPRVVSDGQMLFNISDQ